MVEKNIDEEINGEEQVDGGKGNIAGKEKKDEVIIAKKNIQKTETTKTARKVAVDKTVDPFETIQFVLMTEKCVRLIEAQNKLVFVVRRQARKKQIKKAVENAFQSPVSGVTTLIDQKGRKRAFVKFSQSGAAGDIAVRLGII